MTRAILCAILLAAPAALPATADVTPAEVWQNWQDLARRSGALLAAAGQTTTRDDISLTGAVYRLETPDGNVVQIGFDEVSLSALGDGRVAIVTSEVLPLTMDLRDAEGEPFHLNLDLRLSGQSITASGTATALRYDYAYDGLTVELTDLSVPESDSPPPSVSLLSALHGVTGHTVAADLTLQQSFSAGAAALTSTVTMPDASGIAAFELSASDLTASGSATLNEAGATAATARDLVSTGSLGIGPTRFQMNGTSEGDTFALTGDMQGASFTGGTSDGVISYTTRTDAPSLRVTGSALPLPELSFRMASTSSTFRMPIVPTDETSPLALGFTLNGIEIDDAIWSMIDPGGALPRDPADIELDLSGKGRWLVDVTDPDFDGTSAENIGEIEEIAIDRLRLSVAGAELSGQGLVKMLNGPEGGFFPAPTPVGSIDLRLRGIAGLMSGLAAIGILPADYMMAGQMMLGIYTTEVDASTRAARLQFNPDGSRSLNGNRIP